MALSLQNDYHFRRMFSKFLTVIIGCAKVSETKGKQRKNKGNMNIKKYGAKTVAYKNLPRTHQMAIAWYMAIDGEAWGPYGINMDKQPTTLSSNKNKDKWEKVYLKRQTSRHLSSYVKEYGRCKFGVVEIPTEVVIREIIKNLGNNRSESVDGFKKHCSETPFLPHYPSKNRWPCILADDDEVLQDGWHRFHSYVRAGHKTIPCIYYLKKEKYFQKPLDIH